MHLIAATARVDSMVVGVRRTVATITCLIPQTHAVLMGHVYHQTYARVSQGSMVISVRHIAAMALSSTLQVYAAPTVHVCRQTHALAH